MPVESPVSPRQSSRQVPQLPEAMRWKIPTLDTRYLPQAAMNMREQPDALIPSDDVLTAMLLEIAAVPRDAKREMMWH